MSFFKTGQPFVTCPGLITLKCEKNATKTNVIPWLHLSQELRTRCSIRNISPTINIPPLKFMKYRAALKAEIIQLPFLYLPYNHGTLINKNVITLSNRKNRFDYILFRYAPDL